MVSSVLANAILSQKAPDILGSFREGQEYVRGEKAKKLTGKLLGGKGSQDDYAELAGLDPEVAFSLGESINAKNASDLNSFIRDAGILERMLKTGQKQAALNFTQQSIRTGQMAGRDTSKAQMLLDQMQSGDWETATQGVNAFTGAVNQSKLMTVSKGQTVIDQYGKEVYSAKPEEAPVGSYSDLGKDLVKQRNLLGSTSRVIKTNYAKLQNLAEQVRVDKNRSSVAQLGVALVKLGDPTSVVKEEELRQAFANPDPSAAFAQLVKDGKVDGGLIQSILVKLDPLNPDTVNVDDILATGDALVKSALPSWQTDYNQFEELLGRLPDQEQGDIVTESFRKNAASLMSLLNNTGRPARPEPPAAVVADPNTPELVDF